MRGEKQHLCGMDEHWCGSSPRAWGKEAVRLDADLKQRIIPTCVGKSLPGGGNILVRADHPHVRGEKARPCEWNRYDPGSSPRAWGKGQAFRVVDQPARIIPTCVGKRRTCDTSVTRIADHPHVRGEKRISGYANGPSGGSSPRAWGKEDMIADNRIAERIIPTCVGKRNTTNTHPRIGSDHPHVRGEKSPRQNSIGLPFGSSPRAWGKGIRGYANAPDGRIIPTCVGKSLSLLR